MLSSQANIAGYKAVIVAADEYQRFMPMLMTAAGTVKAARVVILGVGVAGLQAIATAKRLGAVIEASDVRPAVKEQVESLGAQVHRRALRDRRGKRSGRGRRRLRAADAGELACAGRRSSSHERVARGRHRHHHRADPGPRRRRCWSREEMVKAMKPGSVIVDMARRAGRQLPADAKPTRSVVKHGVTLVGDTNLPALVAADASALYARNVLDFLNLLLDPKTARSNVNRWTTRSSPARWSASTAAVTTNRELVPELERTSHDMDAVDPHRHQPDHLRAGDLRRLPRRLERDAGAAHAADGGDQRDLGDRHRRRDARRRARARSGSARLLGVLAVALAAVNVVRRLPGDASACWRCSRRRTSRSATAATDDASTSAIEPATSGHAARTWSPASASSWR